MYSKRPQEGLVQRARSRARLVTSDERHDERAWRDHHMLLDGRSWTDRDALT